MPGPLPTWCQKLDETTEVILEQKDTTWKIWTKVEKSQNGMRFQFIVKQHSGPTKSAIFYVNTNGDTQPLNRRRNEIKLSNLDKVVRCRRIYRVPNDYQFVISAGVVISDAHRVKSVEEWANEDYMITISDKKFAINAAISDTLHQFGSGTHCHEAELVGVDYEDFITLIDNPEAIDKDLTVEKARRFHMMKWKYGFNHHSKKIAEMMSVDFWSHTNAINATLLNGVAISTSLIVPWISKNYTARFPIKTADDQVSAPEMRISKKYRIPSLPNKFTIYALEMKLDIYFYIQEYNNTSYLSIGVISFMPTDKVYRNEVINLNIQLLHRHNPELSRSADISRKFNNYQRSAGCPTFMLSNELGDYCHNDGSYIVTISLSTTAKTDNMFKYPGIKDVILCCGAMRIHISRDLLLHYCAYFQSSNSSNVLLADIFPIVSLLITFDLIYHRSSFQIINKIQDVLKTCKSIKCPYAQHHTDQLLANCFLNKPRFLTKEFHDEYDLPLLREVERIEQGWEGARIESSKSSNIASIYPCEVPTNARIVRPLTVSRLVDIILPVKVFKCKKEWIRLCQQFNDSNSILKLRQYRMALCTLEGVSQQLRMELRDAYDTIKDFNQEARNDGQVVHHDVYDPVIAKLAAYEPLFGDGGFKELSAKARRELQIVQEVRVELFEVANRCRSNRKKKSWIAEILDRSEEECVEGRRQAAEMFVDMLRKEEGSGMEEEDGDGKDGEMLHEMRCWAKYLDGDQQLQF